MRTGIGATLRAVGILAFASSPWPLAADPGSASSLQPYLGKWRPTSFREEMNTGFLTITQDRMTNEAARAFVKFRFAVKRGEVTVVEVTRHGPAKNYEGLKAMGFMLDRNSYGEEMLWIYYCARLEQVPHNCSTNAYVRAN